MSRKTVEVCLTPDIINQHNLEDKLVIVVDIFRATSCIVSGLSTGVKAIYPVSTVEECLANGERGMITAGERGGQKLDEFDIGNSPFDYMRAEFKGREISVTTTNGTLAIKKSLAARTVLLGAFLNLSSTASFIKQSNLSIVIHCAGWKGTPNLEDTLYAGALINSLGDKFEVSNDSAIMSSSLYQYHHKDLLGAAKLSSHANRLKDFGVRNDIEFCLKSDEFQSVAILNDDKVELI